MLSCDQLSVFCLWIFFGGAYLGDLRFGNAFTNATLEVCSMREKNNELTLLKFKTCALIDTVNRVKRQAPEWEKVFEKHVSDKGLVAKIQKVAFKAQ